jgi:hypothetical protein
MGRLKGGANNEEEAETLTLPQLNKLIAHAEFRLQNMSNAGLRKSAFKRLVWLEAQRERLHGIAAPARRRPGRARN